MSLWRLYTLLICERWFTRFRIGNFDLKDEPRFEQSMKLKKKDLKALLIEDSAQSAQSICKII